MKKEMIELKVKMRFLMFLIKQRKKSRQIDSIRKMSFKELNVYLEKTHALLKYRIPEINNLYSYAYNRKIAMKRNYLNMKDIEPSFYRTWR
jgi:hypothetical protein|tara:strand:+ start:855 stop:1127 length:273 start_codon:yes stop_codon:yes gene_type:complete